MGKCINASGMNEQSTNLIESAEPNKRMCFNTLVVDEMLNQVHF